jgi:hypothetical protein
MKRSQKPSLSSFAGSVWHEPLPLEFAREPEALVRLLDAALKAAGVPVDPTDTLVTTRVLLAPKAALVVLGNERPSDAKRRVRVDGRVFEVPVLAYRARFVLIERPSGRVIAATPGAAVTPVGG